MILENLIKKSKSGLMLATMTAMIGFTSCGGDSGNNIEIPGVDGPTVTLSEDKLLISMVFENVQLDGGIRYAIPDYPQSWLEVSPDLQSAGTLMMMSLDIEDVLNSDLLLLDPQSLPGGRALPGVAGGSLPAVAFSIEKFNNMTFYVGPKVFGFFVPADIGFENGIASFRYYIGEKRAGTISMVGQDENEENAGVLLLLDMNSSTKKRLLKHASKF